MVFAGGGAGGEEGRREKRDFMAMGAERSKPPLHEFSIGGLKWGNQKFLRCMKVDSDAAAGRSPASGTAAAEAARSSSSRSRDDFSKRRDWHQVGFGKSPAPSPAATQRIGGLKRSRLDSDKVDDDGIEAMRVRLILDLKTAVDKVKVSLTGRGEAEEPPLQQGPPLERPWNLRKRRAVIQAPTGGECGTSSKIDERRSGLSPPRTEIKSPPPPPAATAGRTVSTFPEKKERRRFAVSLSRREIEEDYYAMVGQRPPRRPKKRSKTVQKELDSLFPGSWLTEVTTDMYKVLDLPA